MSDPGTNEWDFFVSYTAADQVWAEWIAWELEEAGHSVLFQAWDFVPGSHWTSRMRDGMVGARHTLAILSPDYLRSVYGQAEWEAAYRADPQGFARRLIPIRVRDCPRPDLLGGVVSFDLFDCTADEAKRRLQTRIGQALAGRAKPVTAPAFPGFVDAAPPPSRPPATRPAFPNRHRVGAAEARPKNAVPKTNATVRAMPKKRPVRPSALRSMATGRRTLLAVGGMLTVLGISGAASSSYVNSQYYVGATDAGQLAIFRGISGGVAGLDLNTVVETSPARIDDLTAYAQERIKQGLAAEGHDDASRRLAELTRDDPSNPNLKPLCDVSGGSTSGAAGCRAVN